MVRIPNNVLAFAGADHLDVYKMFADYYNHYRAQYQGAKVEYKTEEVNAQGQIVKISFAEKEEAMNAALRKEIMRQARISEAEMASLPIEAWASHPVLRWAAFATINAMIDVVLPEVLIDSIGLYTEFRNVGWGENASFQVKSRDVFYTVSKHGKGRRMAELKSKRYEGKVFVNPELREMSAAVSLFNVLAGRGDSLAELATNMIRSMELQINLDAYTLFASTMDALPNTATTGLRVAGYSQSVYGRLCDQVRAWNGGAQPICVGTRTALSTIIPTDANYRFDIQSSYTRLGYMTDFLGVPVIEIPQIADFSTPFGLKIADNRLWILAPQAGKFLKLVFEGGSLGNTTDAFSAADLLTTTTVMKSWGLGVASSAVAAVITL